MSFFWSGIESRSARDKWSKMTFFPRSRYTQESAMPLQRSLRVGLWAVVAAVSFPSPAPAEPGKYIAPGWNNFDGTTFSKTTSKVLGTIMFYWYDENTGQHLVDVIGGKPYDALTSHPLKDKD